MTQRQKNKVSKKKVKVDLLAGFNWADKMFARMRELEKEKKSSQN